MSSNPPDETTLQSTGRPFDRVLSALVAVAAIGGAVYLARVGLDIATVGTAPDLSGIMHPQFWAYWFSSRSPQRSSVARTRWTAAATSRFWDCERKARARSFWVGFWCLPPSSSRRGRFGDRR